jgi:hypothetical protein
MLLPKFKKLRMDALPPERMFCMHDTALPAYMQHLMEKLLPQSA